MTQEWKDVQFLYSQLEAQSLTSPGSGGSSVISQIFFHFSPSPPPPPHQLTPQVMRERSSLRPRGFKAFILCLCYLFLTPAHIVLLVWSGDAGRAQMS